MEKPYIIENLENYRKDGNHQKCIIDLPFDITKGLDGFSYYDKKGKIHQYNMFKSGRIDDRWIIFIKPEAPESLKKLFDVKMSKDLERLIRYAVGLYKKSLDMEQSKLRYKFRYYL